MKECFKCRLVKPLDCFYSHPEMPDGHVNKCKECNKKDVRLNYSVKKDYYKQYDKDRQKYSIDRILSHRYNGLKARSEVEYAHTNNHKYTVTGMPYLSKKDFIEWSKTTMDDFMRIYIEWAKSGYDTKYMPSVDRIDSKKGYTSDNMQWLSKSENCKKYTH